MNLISNVLFSDTVKHPNRIVRKIKRGKFIPGYYVIRQAYGNDQLEIIKSEYFVQKYLRNEPLNIIGFASDYSEALEMATGLINEAISEIGEPDIDKYLGL